MLNPTSLSEQMLFSTVMIETERPNGVAIGTGFFFTYQFDDQKIQVIITNKHVIKNGQAGRFRLHQVTTSEGCAVPSGNFFTVEITNQFAGYWISHPDRGIDLCAIIIDPWLRVYSNDRKTPYFTSLNEGNIWTDSKLEELSAAEEILMFGYPRGLWDKKNNLPLIRRGVTSSHPAIDFSGKSHGVIDMACFHGSSGSPVLILNEGIYVEKPRTIGGMSNVKAGHRGLLLGVLFAGPIINPKGKIVIKPIPFDIDEDITHNLLLLHLGYYIKAKEILKLGDEVREVVCEQERRD